MRFLIIIALVLFAASASAQSLSVFNLDATNFPSLKASFYAFDANGQQQSPSASEITVTEDGIPRIVTNITCPPKSTPPPITLGIMVDTYSGIDLAKEGAQKLINLVSIPPSEAGITMMDHGAFIVQDLTQKTSKLTTAITKLQPAPGVDLQTMFYAPNAGGVPFVSGRLGTKALVLITDLHCPLFNLYRHQLYQDSKAQNISVYIVLLGTKDEFGYSKEITDSTGGMLFEQVADTTQFNLVLNQIYSNITKLYPCEIDWQSDVNCNGNMRNALFKWNSNSSSLSFTVPTSAISGLKFTPSSLYFHSNLIGVKFDTTVTITANNEAFSVTDITSTNPSYDINPKTFSLAQGETKTLTVSYTPPDSSYTWTRFDIANDRCAQTYYASASYPGHKPNVPTLKLTAPNGGEIYLEGSDTLITWKGIPLTDTVKLEYSIDSGNTWKFITDKATMGKYVWHVPGVASNKCLIRVEQIPTALGREWCKIDGTGDYEADGMSVTTDEFGNIYMTGNFCCRKANFGDTILTPVGARDIFIAKYFPDGSLVWARQAGGPGDDYGHSIAVDGLGNIYVTGIFDSTANFGGVSLTSMGGEDIFIAKYSSDGNIQWVKQAGGTSDDDGASIFTDISGDIYLTGYFSGRSANFESTTLFDSGVSNMFIAKYHPDGTLAWVKSIPDTSQGAGYGITADTIGNIYVTGVFTNAKFDSVSLKSAGNSDIFIAKYHNDGNIDWVKAAGGKSVDEGHSITLDPNGNIFVTGFFSDTANFDGTILNSSGSTDIFVAKYLSDGTNAWVKRAGSSDIDQGDGITADELGNVYVTGYFQLSADFEGVTLTSKGGLEIFVAKYQPNGQLAWAKRAGGTYYNRGYGIKSITNDNLYVTGHESGPSDFDDIQIGGYANIFLWKIGDIPLQSDTSDAVFSIIAPTFSFSANTIDMGQVETGTEKDSVVKATICNNGNMPLHVLGMDVTGGDKAEFMIMSGAGDFTLQPSECRDVMFSYLPMLTGKVSATVTLRTANGNYADTIKILGEGIAPLLAVMGNTIDFGQVKIGSYKDTTIVIAIENIGKTTVNFSPATQLGPDVKQFSLQSGAAGFTLPAGATQSISLRFTPKYIGRTSGRIGFGYNGPSTPAIMNVYGQGLGGLVSMADYSGYPGEHKYIPMILEKVPVSSVQSLATNFSARIAYDNSVLSPDSGVVQKGNRFDTVNVAGSLKTSDTLIFIPFTALLGERTFSPLNIVDFNWLDGTGNPVDYDVDTKSGTFTVSNGCGDSLLRNFMLTGKMAAITSISPNPSKSITHIEIQTTEKGRTQLEVMNLLGLKVATIWDSELQTGSHSFDFKTSDLPSGSYFVVMTTPSVRRIERIDVAK